MKDACSALRRSDRFTASGRAWPIQSGAKHNVCRHLRQARGSEGDCRPGTDCRHDRGSRRRCGGGPGHARGGRGVDGGSRRHRDRDGQHHRDARAAGSFRHGAAKPRARCSRRSGSSGSAWRPPCAPSSSAPGSTARHGLRRRWSRTADSCAPSGTGGRRHGIASPTSVSRQLPSNAIWPRES